MAHDGTTTRDPTCQAHDMSLLRQSLSHVHALLLSALFTVMVPVCAHAADEVSPPRIPSSGRTFQTSFESVDDFRGFYIVPKNHMGTASHDRSSEHVHTGRFAHKGWIYGANPIRTFENTNHRGYPTIQLHKTPQGAFHTPVFIEFWVWLDMAFAPGEWFNFATLDHTTSTKWDPVLVNLSDKGFVHLMHVPTHRKGTTTFQTSTIQFPMKPWVKLTVVLHFDPERGYAKVWQNDQLVSTAEVRRGTGLFTQAHFGLYAPPSVSNGVVYNDDVVIKELLSFAKYRDSLHQDFAKRNHGMLPSHHER